MLDYHLKVTGISMGFSFLFYIPFSPSIQEKDKISEIRSTKQRKRDDEIERQNWEAKREREKRVTRERQQQEKNFWEEKLGAELRVAEKRLDKKRPQEKAAKAKLSQVKDKTL